MRIDTHPQSPLEPGDAAARFDPPLRRQDWRVARRLSLAAFLADARARWQDGPASFERLLWHGGLHLNGRPLLVEGASASLAAGAVVEADSFVTAWGFRREPEVVPVGAERVLFEAGDVIAVDKPAWLPVQGTRASQRLSLERALRELTGCPSLAAVHRLDRQTSGVVLFARGPDAARRLGRALGARDVARRYLAVTVPAPREDRFEVAGDLVRVPDPARFRFALAHGPCRGGRFSHTRFACLARAAGRAWLRASPRTGRTHQLRVHLAAAGIPIAGDPVYGMPGRAPSASRMQLHARSLRFPLGGREVEVVAPLPADFSPPPGPSPRPAGGRVAS